MISFALCFGHVREKHTKTQFICKLTKYHFSLKEIILTKNTEKKRALMLKLIKVLYLNSSPQQGFFFVPCFVFAF